MPRYSPDKEAESSFTLLFTRASANDQVLVMRELHGLPVARPLPGKMALLRAMCDRLGVSLCDGVDRKRG